MITYTKDEYAIYQKVKLALLQEDICTLVSNHIIETQIAAKRRPDLNYNEEIASFEKFYNKISDISKPEDMDIYEKETEDAYWDPDWFEVIVGGLVYSQEKEDE